MNALLIYPEFPDTFWSFKHALRFVGKRASLPPLGLLTVGAMLPDDWGKCLVDLNVRKLRDRDLAGADCVFLSAMAVQRASAVAIVARCREAGVPVIAGGPLFTTEEDPVPGVRCRIRGEAEQILPDVLRDLGNGCLQEVYTAPGFADPNTTPVPLWRLADLKRYHSVGVQYSRGCPHDCEFCNVTTLFGRKPRLKDPDRVIAELDALLAIGWKGNVFFVDDNFLGNRGHLKKHLLPRLIDWQKENGRRVPLYTESTISLADDDDLMAMMVEAGFDTVFIGIETPDDNSLRECNKEQNRNRDLIADVRRIQRTGLQVQGGFIVGFDSDTPAIFRRQLEFIQESGIVTAMVGLLEALPGTRLYERLKREDRITELPTSGDNTDGTTNVRVRMGADALRRGYRSLVDSLYSPDAYYRRVRTFLRAYGRPLAKVPLTSSRLLAFVRSAIRLGIFGRERFHYWGLFLWTLFRRPRLLPLAVTFAIYGYHFRKVFHIPSRRLQPGAEC